MIDAKRHRYLFDLLASNEISRFGCTKERRDEWKLGRVEDRDHLTRHRVEGTQRECIRVKGDASAIEHLVAVTLTTLPNIVPRQSSALKLLNSRCTRMCSRMLQPDDRDRLGI